MNKKMLKNIECDENTVYIGYLHDILEDTKYDYYYLVKKYGKTIANGVLLLSENKRITNYIERKKAFINQLKKADNNLILVEIADKLQNLISDYEGYKKNGKNFLITEANNFEEQKWYYLELKKVFNKKIQKNELLDRFNKITHEYFEK